MLTAAPDDGTIFVTTQGEPFGPRRLTRLVKDYVDRAQTGKKGACHLFRHTMATLMLEGGADIRFSKLEQIHAATHPAAKVESKAGAGESDGMAPDKDSD